jgi:hypothetical protein
MYSLQNPTIWTEELLKAKFKTIVGQEYEKYFSFPLNSLFLGHNTPVFAENLQVLSSNRIQGLQETLQRQSSAPRKPRVRRVQYPAEPFSFEFANPTIEPACETSESEALRTESPEKPLPSTESSSTVETSEPEEIHQRELVDSLVKLVAMQVRENASFVRNMKEENVEFRKSMKDFALEIKDNQKNLTKLVDKTCQAISQLQLEIEAERIDRKGYIKKK